MTGHFLDAGVGRARDLVAAEGLVNADEDTGLPFMLAMRSDVA